jgi:CheY-like chemotaxis protein
VSKILVVDDNERVLQIVSRMLGQEGYEIIVADSGKKCLEILKNEKPDLILMDVMMPEMDGWKVVKEIKKDEANKDIIISMLTIKSTEQARVKSLADAKADWHIGKPITKTKLVETVRWLLTKK